jgi:hypothetical protein
MTFKKAILPAAVLLGLGAMSGGASAAYLAPYTGWVEMSDCASCDSTVSFAVYWNTGNTGNWMTDLGVTANAGTGADGVGTEETFVYFYQVVNTDFEDSGEASITDFKVSDLHYKVDNFRTIGWLPGTVFNDAGGAVGGAGNVNLGTQYAADVYVDDALPDSPLGNGTPRNSPESDRNPETSDSGGTAQSGDTGLSGPGFTTAATTAPLSAVLSESILAVNLVDFVAAWHWSTNPLATGATGPVLFATSPYGPTYYWASSEAPDGNSPGASGDVPTPVPLPATWLLIGAGVAGLGCLRRKSRG